LQYFATKRKLNFRQASWSEFIALFRYILHYRPGKQNLIADLLLRKAQDLVTQKAIKDWNRNQVLLPPDYFTGGTPKAEILAILPNTPKKAEPVKFNGPNELILIDVILAINRELPLFFDQRKLAKASIQKYTI
jgi:hypothetical protein